MTYYGRLFGLCADKIEKRTEELLKFLELPSKTSIVGKLRYVMKIIRKLLAEIIIGIFVRSLINL